MWLREIAFNSAVGENLHAVSAEPRRIRLSHVRLFQAKGTASVEARKLRRGSEGLRSRKEASRVCWASVRESGVRRLDSVLRALGRLGKDFEEERHIVFTLKRSLAAV